MSDRAVPQPGLARVILVALGVVQLTNGLYALFNPTGFYDDFPLGRSWVAAYPDYSEHLVTDVGGLFIATGVLMLFAAAWLSRRMVLAATVSWLCASVPHTIFHAVHLGDLSGTGDRVAEISSLLATVVLPVWLLTLVLRDSEGQPQLARQLPSSSARIALLDKPRGLVARMTYRESRRRFGQVMDPAKAFAHTPALMAGYGALELAAEKSHHADTRLKELAVMRAAMLTGCAWCLDFGTAKVIAEGVPEEDLKALPTYATSDRFSPVDKLVLDYATGMTRTPVEVSDDLVAQLREHLSDAAIAEITLMVSLENLRARYNWALGIGSQGFSEGAFCVPPEKGAGHLVVS